MKKHQSITNDSRVRITNCRLIRCAGDKCPWFGLAKGKRLRKGYSAWELEKRGAPPGSRIIMCENAYMSNEVFEILAPYLAEAIRNMPVVRDHPTWWVLLRYTGYDVLQGYNGPCLYSLDGCTPHVSLLKALRLLAEHRYGC